MSQGICVRNSPNAGDSVHGHQSSNTFVSGLAIDASFIIHNSIVRRLYCFSITQSSASAGLRFGALWCALWFPPSHETPFYFICSLSSGINPTFIWYPCVEYCWLLSRSPVFVIMCKKKDIIWSRFSSESCANQPFLLLSFFFVFFRGGGGGRKFCLADVRCFIGVAGGGGGGYALRNNHRQKRKRRKSNNTPQTIPLTSHLQLGILAHDECAPLFLKRAV